MTLYEINYAPTKRVVRGVHMWDLAYLIHAETLDQAKAESRKRLADDANGAAYKLTAAYEVKAGDGIAEEMAA